MKNMIRICIAASILLANAALSQNDARTPDEKFCAALKEYRLMPKGGSEFEGTYAQFLKWDFDRDTAILGRIARAEASRGMLFANEYYGERISQMASAWRDSVGLERICVLTRWQKRSGRAAQKAEGRCGSIPYAAIEHAMRVISEEESRDVAVSIENRECGCPDSLFRYIMDESSEDMLELRKAIESKRLRYLAVAYVESGAGKAEIFAEYKTGLFRRRFRAVPFGYLKFGR